MANPGTLGGVETDFDFALQTTGGTVDGDVTVTGTLTTGTLSATNLSVSGNLTVAGTSTLAVTTATTPATADNSTRVATTAYTQGLGGQLPATATNDNAPAGKVGEYTSSIVLQANAVTLPNNTPTVVTTLALTVGDWDVWGDIYIFSTGSVRGVGGSISPASGALPTDPQDNVSITVMDPSSGSAVDSYRAGISPCRFSLAAPGTAYLQAQAAIQSGTASAYGKICARRAR
jgi:hypothetical protein